MNHTITISNGACILSTTLSDLKNIEKSKSDRIVTKTCTLQPISSSFSSEEKTKYEYDGFGAINMISLVNKGFYYYKDFLFSKPYVISITGTVDEINQMLSIPSTATFFELNISCPNTKFKNITIDDLKYIHYKNEKVGIKLPPVCDIDSIVKYSNILNQIDNIFYVVCCNTIPRGVINDKEGSLSGKYIQPVSLWNVRHFRKYLNSNIEIYGCGGISTKKDIDKYRKEGVSGVQIATEFIERGPDIFEDLNH